MKTSYNLVRLLVEILLIVACAEVIVMRLLPVIAPGAQGWAQHLTDAVALVMLAGPLIFWRTTQRWKAQFGAPATPLDAGLTRPKAMGLALAAQVIGLLLTGAGVLWQRANLDETARTHFGSEADRLEREFVRRLNSGQFALKGLRGTYAASSDVSKAEFRSFVESLDMQHEFPGLRGFGFIQRVARDGLDRFEAEVRADDAPEFKVKTSGSAPDLWVIRFIEPASNNWAAWGFDVGQEPLRRAAAERAVDTGEAALTGRINLVQDGKKSPGFLLFLPIFRPGTDPSTPAQRRAALVGLAYTPIVASELLDGLGPAVQSTLDFEAFQGAEVREDQRIYGAVGVEASAGKARAKFVTQRTLEVAGSKLTLRLRSTPAYELAQDRSSLTLVALLGVGSSFLVAWAVWLLASGHARAQLLAQRMTADLDRMARVVQHTNNAVTISDADQRITWVNAGFSRLTGYTLAEALGKTPGELLGSGKASPEVLQVLEQAAARGELCRVEILNRTKDGREYWTDTELQPIRDAQGELIGFMEIGTDITHQKTVQQHLEMAMREANALLSTVEIHAIVSVSDRHGVIMDVNAAFCEASGYSREELIGQSHRQLNSGVHPPAFWASMWKTVSSGKPWRGDICNRAKDGSLFWVDSMIAPFLDEDGQVGKYVSIRTDITARVKDKEKIAELSQRMALAIEGGNDGLWDWMDITQDAQWWSPSYHAMLGYQPDELTPSVSSHRALIHPDFVEQSRTKLKAALAGGQDYDMELQLRTKSAGYRWFRLRAKVYTNDQGQPVRMAGSTQDITDRKHIEEALKAALASAELSAAAVQESQDVLRSSIEALDDAFVLYGADDRLVLCNERYREFYPETAAILQPGKRFEDIIRFGAERGQYQEAIGRVDAWVEERMALHRLPHSRLQQRLRGGRIVRVVERKTEAGYSVGFRVDITDLVQATEAAEEASRSKSQFLANMSHEIRTPMNAILGMLKLLKNTELTPRQSDYTGKTEAAARSLLGLLNDILDFSKVEAGKMTLDPRPFRIDQVLRDLSVILSANVGQKDIEVLFDIDPNLPEVVVGDDMRLQQVLINLGGNAIKFTETGEVILKVRLLEKTDDAVQIEFAVQDSGIGIAPENQQHIFSGFSQAEANTTRRFGGTGLGLAISSRLTALLGGQLQLQSHLGEGSTFSFQIRLALAGEGVLAENAALSPALPAAPSNPKGPLRVLVVDDNPIALNIMVHMCQSLGWQVEASDSGRKAIAQAQASAAAGAPFHAVFVDWHMPEIDGWQTGREIRAAAMQVPADSAGDVRPLIFMVSAHGRDMLAQRSVHEQALLDGFLVKPVTATMLRDALQEAQTANTAAAAGHNPMAPQAPAKQQRLQGLRILVVEDNKINQLVAQGLLSAEGAHITLAEDGQRGVDAVVSAQPLFDAVLMDVQMPVMDGYTATRTLRAQPAFQHLPIIAMTANAMASDRAACLAAGMNDHVGKPFELDHLVATLLRFCSQSAAAPLLVAQRPPEQPKMWPAGDLDLDGALARLGGNEALLSDILQPFARDLPQLPQRVADMLASDSTQELARTLHTLKGLAATVGARHLSHVAAQLELRSKAPLDPTQHQVFLADLTSAVEASGRSLQQAMAKFAEADVQEVQDPIAQTWDRTAFLADIAVLVGLLESDDMQALQAHTTLRTRYASVLGAALTPLADAMATLEFERALQCCKDLQTLP